MAIWTTFPDNTIIISLIGFAKYLSLFDRLADDP